MVNHGYIVKGSCVVGVLALAIHLWMNSLLKPLVYTLSTVIGVLAGIWHTCIASGRTYQPNHSNAVPKLFRTMFEEKNKERKDWSPSRRQTLLISKSVDGVLNEIIEFFIRDFVLPWYKPLVSETDSFLALVRQEIWLILENIKGRLEKIDDVKLLTQDFVVCLQEHFHHLRLATSPGQERIAYKLYPFLQSPSKEMEYLRQLSEFFLVLLLPPRYAKLQPLRHLLREVIAKYVLWRLVQQWSDPVHLNQKILDYLHWQQLEMERSTRTYTFAETYEDFIRIINHATSVEELKGLRIYIVTEMMQASAITNLKRAKGIKVDKEYSPQMTTKGELLQSRNLRQYINQLRFAKWTCEKRIKYLGGPDYLGGITCRGGMEGWPHGEDEGPVPGRQILSLDVILESPHCREYLAKYLEREDSHCLVRFWEAVEEMKSADKTSLHQLANQICQTYVNNPNCSIKLSKTILKGMKSFLLANTGPDAFYQAQNRVYKILDDRFYPSFIVSSVYHQMMVDAEKKGIDFSKLIQKPDEKGVADEVGELMGVEDDDDKWPSSKLQTDCLSEQNKQSRHRLYQLEDKYRTKQQALQALLGSSKTESSKMVGQLEQEVEELRQELDQLKWYIQHTDLWIQHLGHWKATVQSVEAIKEEGEKTAVYATILVHQMAQPDTGWAVARSVAAFHSLHAKLSQIAPELRKVELPSANKPRFKSYDEATLSKIKAHLQHFLTIIMNNDTLYANENIFLFLNFRPDKDPFLSPKKSSKFSLLNFFKSSQSSNPGDVLDEDDDFFALEDADKEDRKDSIAEPLYLLIGEIFELTGVFNMLRRTLISIVQITFGKTINRQLRESVSWLTSEPMVLYYAQQVRDSIWPQGELKASPDVPHASTPGADDERVQVREQAKQLVLNNIPELLCHVVGQQNARKGVAKVMDAMQNQSLNKQLIYSLLEAFIYEFAPELRS